MKKFKYTAAFLLLSLILIFSACGSSSLDPVETVIDLSSSIYKHINNGGIEDADGLPYDIDAITGATLTVEGPGVVTSTPLSIREVENLKTGIVRGQYKDKTGTYTYEGLDLYHLLYEMTDGDNGINLTDTAYKVLFKDANREDVYTLAIDEIKKAHDAGRPAILAYGIGTEDGSLAAPFVFDGAKEGLHSLGYIDKLKNDDGCIKLAVDSKDYGTGSYKHFSNVAYVYVCEEKEPGFKHSSGDEDSPYNVSRYNDYIISFRGSALGHEFDLTTKDLEALVSYDSKGNIKKGGIGYSDWYSLANNAYWYVNQYEGLKLYEFLQYLGMQSAEDMGLKAARTTLVSFIASDGVAANETFSVDTLSYPDAFGFYKKNAKDTGDGTYVSSNADLVKLGYPILISYGVNGYPYVIQKTDKAYVSGLSNAGGPVRVVFGKTQYNHPNGSNQIQYLSEVIVGDDLLSNTHKYTDQEDQRALSEYAIHVKVKNSDGTMLLDKDLTVADIEDIIYGEDVSGQQKRSAKVKDHYEVQGKSSIFEGVDMQYLLMEYIGLPGTNGTVTFRGKEAELTVSLEDLFKKGLNKSLSREDIPAVLAFAKNGMPLADENGKGYVKSISLKPYLNSDPKEYEVDNLGGPLMFIMPAADYNGDSSSVASLSEIEIDLIPDSYAHIDGEYSAYGQRTIRFYGEGLEKEKTYTLSEIESKQRQVKTVDALVASEDGTLAVERYRGIGIYDLFKEIGINNNAGDVTISCADGSSRTYSLISLKKSYPVALPEDKGVESFDAVPAMLVYGMGDTSKDRMEGTPLTEKDGGPIKLIVPYDGENANKELCLENVVSVHVSANEINTWSHSMSDVYSEFLSSEFTLSFKNDEHRQDVTFTIAQLEAMEDIILRDNYTVLDIGECEGLDVWKLIKKTCGDKIDPSKAISITAYASDGYSNDLLANCYLSAFTDGIPSEAGGNKAIILAYAIKGYPLVDTENHEGYTGLAKNCDGPLRIVVEGFQGGSIKYCNRIVVTLPGNEEIDLKAE